MDKIIISDLEVHYCVGVPDAERAQPQRLLVSLELGHDFSRAAATDDLAHTINYFAVAQRLQGYGQGRSWKLIETLAVELAEMVLRDYQATSVCVEVKKFILPDTRYVAVRVSRQGNPSSASLRGVSKSG